MLARVFAVLYFSRVSVDFCVMNLAEALNVINSAKPFDCKWVSYDAKRNTGGKIKTDKLVITHAPIHGIKGEQSESKAQNHFSNSTRNCYVCVDNQVTSIIRKIHIYLILEINGQKLEL